jgi:hypothetical protein
MALNVGQQVVCIEYIRSAIDEFAGASPTKGGIYTVQTVVLDFRAVESITLAEIPVVELNGRRTCFVAAHFRPVKQTSIEIFQQLLVNPPREVVS